MYCVKCGVELASSEEKCPLCNTPVYYPVEERGEKPYPKYTKTKEEISPRGLYFILSFLFAIAIIITVMCDLGLNKKITFSGYVSGGLILGYVVFILPLWFRRPSPAIFAPVSFFTAALYLLYIDLTVGGGWFLPFALPITGALALIICSMLILCYYLRCGYLYIFGGVSIALGAFCLFLEIMLHVNFSIHEHLVWSLYPLVTLFLMGIMLIIIAIVKPFKESLKKIFML